MRTEKRLRSMSKGLLLVALGSLLTVAFFSLPDRTSPVVAEQSQPPAHGLPATNRNLTKSEWAPVNGKGGQEISGPYQVVKGWPQPVTEGWTINAEGVYIESKDRIIAVGRGTRKF